uniref:Ymf69 n=1 Tax=Tetrahymena thermophila TaxID=5911 RepID=Q951A2_TETTH|nr:ymf69 [Tetrahymena thermophila]AAK77580.1 ymf69 [Tetrahymena thermophila]6Z1P_Af Chain Af, Ymf69 [Tetrahymena thermophila SB210]
MLNNIFIFEKYLKKNNFKKNKIILKKKFTPLRFFLFLLSLFLTPFNCMFIISFKINNKLEINFESYLI